MEYRRWAVLGAAVLMSGAALAPAGSAQERGGRELELTLLGRYESGSFDEGAAEITAYDPGSARAFTVNAERGTVDVLDLSDPAAPRRVAELATPGANSVAVGRGGLVAVAQEAADRTDPGTVSFFRARDARRLWDVTVGALPDAVTFTPDGRRAVVVNEGEPGSYCEADRDDPEGSVSVITLRGGRQAPQVRTADFRAFDDDAEELRAQGVRLFGPGASVAQDLEPEYAAVSADGRTALVTLQENNAVARVDLTRARVTEVRALGTQDHSEPGNGLDPSDRDGGARIANWPVRGLYQPDGIAGFRDRGRQYYVTANEGDAREWDCYEEEVRVRDLELSPEAFPDAAALQDNAALGRLTVSETSPRDGQGRVTELHAFGGRSLSVLDDRGRVVWDSGDALERLTAERFPADFNTDNSENDPDSRSDAKGPEPEGVTVGSVNGRTYAFAGLERVGGIVAHDLSDPRNPRLAGYINSRDFAGDPEAGTAGDLGPEGLAFIPAHDSPNGRALLVVGHETSGTTAVYQVG
ncbi:choice-of-anchor I family protein [Streptomyces sp. DSM 44917]|uniref:Choice-of-anchor I family protein n=1 Tax=Streptomyces boetiae TaxID=3075541 RepID=A0ABU2L9A8_9ACTN|nr:choice-of-anchor I family protein [Streptomyces sp. DSM 44917]MDT0308161.1 choice-of-anchor I family protein [Streptomyces sp. DSM 44917]